MKSVMTAFKQGHVVAVGSHAGLLILLVGGVVWVDLKGVISRIVFLVDGMGVG